MRACERTSCEGGEPREQIDRIEGRRRTVTLARQAAAEPGELRVRSPVVVFHPGEMVLSSGPASKRRTLLDRIALFVDRDFDGSPAERYTEASRSRQRTLEMRGTDSSRARRRSKRSWPSTVPR